MSGKRILGILQLVYVQDLQRRGLYCRPEGVSQAGPLSSMRATTGSS